MDTDAAFTRMLAAAGPLRGVSSAMNAGSGCSQVRGTQTKMSYEPHAHGWRAHLAKAHAAPRCGAKRRDGSSCASPAMKNGRCRMHGGLSTGPRTAEGLASSRRAKWKHGHYSADAKAARSEARQTVRLLRKLLARAL
jgi:hypothetical protein